MKQGCVGDAIAMAPDGAVWQRCRQVVATAIRAGAGCAELVTMVSVMYSDVTSATAQACGVRRCGKTGQDVTGMRLACGCDVATMAVIAAGMRAGS